MAIDLRGRNECLKSRNDKFWYKFYKRKQAVQLKKMKLCLKSVELRLQIKPRIDIEHHTSVLNWSGYVKEKNVNISLFQSKKKLM